MNLYNLNNSKDNIKLMGKAIVFESEKSCLLYQSYFGIESDISVACCGSNLSIHQVQLLLDAGAKEIIVAFDRQFEDIGDKEFKHLTKNLTKLNNKYKNEVLISFILAISVGGIISMGLVCKYLYTSTRGIPLFIKFYSISCNLEIGLFIN